MTGRDAEGWFPELIAEASPLDVLVLGRVEARDCAKLLVAVGFE